MSCVNIVSIPTWCWHMKYRMYGLNAIFWRPKVLYTLRPLHHPVEVRRLQKADLPKTGRISEPRLCDLGAALTLILLWLVFESIWKAVCNARLGNKSYLQVIYYRDFIDRHRNQHEGDQPVTCVVDLGATAAHDWTILGNFPTPHLTGCLTIATRLIHIDCIGIWKRCPGELKGRIYQNSRSVWSVRKRFPS